MFWVKLNGGVWFQNPKKIRLPYCTSGHWFALLAIQWYFTKRKQKKIELVARPARSIAAQFCCWNRRSNNLASLYFERGTGLFRFAWCRGIDCGGSEAKAGSRIDCGGSGPQTGVQMGVEGGFVADLDLGETHGADESLDVRFTWKAKTQSIIIC